MEKHSKVYIKDGTLHINNDPQENEYKYVYAEGANWHISNDGEVWQETSSKEIDCAIMDSTFWLGGEYEDLGAFETKEDAERGIASQEPLHEMLDVYKGKKIRMKIEVIEE